MDTNLQSILQESKLRYENRKTAILLGLFGTNSSDIIQNLKPLDEVQAREAEKAERDLQTTLFNSAR